MKKYKFKLEKDYIFKTNYLSNKTIFCVSNGKLFATLKYNGVLIISKDYAWDGCSPKFNFLDLFIFGTPDGVININTMKPKTYYASLVHDVLYQFSKELNHIIDRKKADKVFLYILRRDDFILSKIYYLAVRYFGWLFYKRNKK